VRGLESAKSGATIPSSTILEGVSDMEMNMSQAE
jgi:hypothetical protein